MTHSTAETLAAPRARLLHRLRLNNALTLLIWGLLVALVLIGAGQVFQFNAKPWIGALALALLIWGMVRDWRLPSRLAYKLDHLAGLNQGYATASELADQHKTQALLAASSSMSSAPSQSASPSNAFCHF